jgi:hypothetical protein
VGDVVQPECHHKHRPSPASNVATIRHRARLCFNHGALRLDAGEAAGSIEPGTRFPGRSRIIRRGIPVALSNVRSQLRRARRVADVETSRDMTRIGRAVRRGIWQLRHNPHLLVRGEIPAFERADQLARRAGLRTC